MLSENWLVWNVRGLKSRARHNVVREIISQENISLLSLQETKLDDCPPNMVLETCGADFDFFFQPQPIPLAVSFWLGEEMPGRSHLLLFGRLACLLQSCCYKLMKPGGLHVFMVRNWIMKNRCFWKNLGYVRLARVGGSCGVISISSIKPRTRITIDLIDG